MASEAGQIAALAERLSARIRATGPISVAEYMAEANAHYYGTRDPFGVAGDFTTAPEISQIFGELIGAWCADYWQRMGAPDPVLLVELGPGRGTLMADALRATRNVPGFLKAVRLHLIERSPLLRRVQQENLGKFSPVFHDDATSLPDGPVLSVANEFLDVLPIRQFERRGGTWYERRITLARDGASLTFSLDREPSRSTPELPDRRDGDIAELCPAATALGHRVGRQVAAQGGAVLFVDYGYVEGKGGDTLQAVRDHRAHPVLEAPGSADLTAHVDFRAVAEAAESGGAKVYGPVTQREFLLRLGLERRQAKLLERATPEQAGAIESGCKRLVDGQQMGVLFKVLALTHKSGPVPAGFSENQS